MKAEQLVRETKELLKTLPAKAEWEDLMYRIYVKQKVDNGLKDSAARRVYTTSDVRKALKLAT
jgi:hypothetical protein